MCSRGRQRIGVAASEREPRRRRSTTGSAGSVGSLDDVVLEPDGRVRFVLAHGSTPHPNWLDTGGHREGFLTFRWVGPRDSQPPLPTIRRVNRSELETVLREHSDGAAIATGRRSSTTPWPMGGRFH